LFGSYEDVHSSEGRNPLDIEPRLSTNKSQLL